MVFREKIQEELGWVAKNDLHEGIKKYMSDLGLLS